jgi:hypothetical protein
MFKKPISSFIRFWSEIWKRVAEEHIDMDWSLATLRAMRLPFQEFWPRFVNVILQSDLGYRTLRILSVHPGITTSSPPVAVPQAKTDSTIRIHPDPPQSTSSLIPSL